MVLFICLAHLVAFVLPVGLAALFVYDVYDAFADYVVLIFLGVIVIAVTLVLMPIFMAWKASRWAWYSSTYRAISLGFGMMVSVLLFVALTVQPYSFVGLAYVFMTLSALPLTSAIYVHTSDGGTISVSGESIMTSFEVFRKRPHLGAGDRRNSRFSILQQHSLSSLVTSAIPSRLRRYGVIIIGEVKSLIVILAFALVVWFLLPAVAPVGFFVLINIFILDVVIAIFAEGGDLSANTIVLLLVISRFGAIVASSRFWFLSACLLYILWSLYLGASLVREVVVLRGDEKTDTGGVFRKIRSRLFKLSRELVLFNSNFGGERSLSATLNASVSSSFAKSNLSLLGESTPSASMTDTEMGTLAPFKARKREKDRRFSKVARRGLRAYCLLFLALIIETIVIWYLTFISDRDSLEYAEAVTLFENTHPQYVFGVFAVLFPLVFLAGMAGLRLLSASGWQITKGVRLTFLLFVLLNGLLGAIMWLLTASQTIIVTSIFLPAIFFSFILFLRLWRRTYCLWPTVEGAAAASVKQALNNLRAGKRSGRLTGIAAWLDLRPHYRSPPTGGKFAKIVAYIMYMGAWFKWRFINASFAAAYWFVSTIILSIAFGALVRIVLTPSWIGTMLLSVMVSSLLWLVAIIKWRIIDTLKDTFIIVCIAFAILVYGGWAMFFWVVDQGMAQTAGNAFVLSTILLFPVIIFLGIALYRWADNEWKMNPLTLRLFVICGALVLGIGIFVTMFVEPINVGIRIIIFVCAVAYGIWLREKRVRSHEFSPFLKGFTLVCFAIFFALAVFSVRPLGLVLGATIMWALLIVIVALSTYFSHVRPASGVQAAAQQPATSAGFTSITRIDADAPSVHHWAITPVLFGSGR